MDALTEQRDEVARKHAVQQRVCADGGRALELDDVAVVQLAADSGAALFEAADSGQPIEPARTATITYAFEYCESLATTKAAFITELEGLGVVDDPPPDLRGYSEMSPAYFVGKPITPNMPQGTLTAGAAYIIMAE